MNTVTTKDTPINKLQIGDFVEVQRDLKYTASGKPWKGSVGVIIAVDDYYFPNVVYMANFGGEASGIPTHDDNLKLTKRGMYMKGSDRFLIDTNTDMEEQLCITTFKSQGKYFLNLEMIHDGESSGTLVAIDPNMIMKLANRLELLAMYNRSISK